jgi:hypothetical protein
MEASYYEVMFSKSGTHQNEYWRVYIELNDQDKAQLEKSVSEELKTRAIVNSAGVLDLLPRDIDGYWPDYGVMAEGVAIESVAGGIEPTLREGKPRVWIIPGA